MNIQHKLTKEELDTVWEQIDAAKNAYKAGEYEGLPYLEGVKHALKWILGLESEPPIEQ